MRTRLLLYLLLLLAQPVAAAADEPLLFGDLQAEPEAELAGQRGGMRMSDTLDISFGIERRVMVNGELQLVTSFRIDSLAEALASGTLPREVAQQILALQNGSNNVLPDLANIGVNGSLTVIQNSLDRQTIEAINTISATLPSLTALRQIGLDTTLRNALALGLTQH